MRILGLERDETACNHYRVLQPLYKLREHKLCDTVILNNWEVDAEYTTEKVMESDIIVFQRPASEDWFNFIKVCQKHGKIIVCDYDDDPFNTSPFNPYYRFVGIKEYSFKWDTGQIDHVWVNGEHGFDIERNIGRNDLFRASFRRADMVTTTTNILKKSFLTLNKNTVVLPNLMDFELFKKYDLVKKEIRIGYQGGQSHYEDLYFVKDAISEVMNKFDNVKFVYFGDVRFKRLFQDIPTHKIEWQDWVPFQSYPYKLSLMNIDIGLCPLVNNYFNRNKSAIKWMDYSVAGAATVASDIPPYNQVIKNNETGLLVKDHKSWVEAISNLVKYKDLRDRLAKSAYDCIYEEHNADKKAYLWRDAYQSLMKVSLEDDVFTAKEPAVSAVG